MEYVSGYENKAGENDEVCSLLYTCSYTACIHLTCLSFTAVVVGRVLEVS